MKVLLINSVFAEGSTGKITHDIYAYLNTHGHEAVACYGRGRDVREKNVYKFGLDWEVNS